MGYQPIEGIRKVEAGRAFTMRGTTYRPGDRVDVSEMEPHKVTQLLSQRILRPVPPKSKTPG